MRIRLLGMLSDGYRRSGGGLLRVVRNAIALNLLATAMSMVAGILVARWLGPSGRGNYAAVTAWFAVSLVVGECGQSAALCYQVANDRPRATDYIKTSRILVLTGGLVIAGLGAAISGLLSGGAPALRLAYLVAFLCCPFVFVGATNGFALQGFDIKVWIWLNLVQPASFLAGIIVLRCIGALTLLHIIEMIMFSVAIGSFIEWLACRRRGLQGGKWSADTAQRLWSYGIRQLLAAAPTTIMVFLDQLVLSQMINARSLGEYAIASSLSVVAYPFVSPIGSVLFPHLARADAEKEPLMSKQAVLAAASISSSLLLGVAVVTPILVPFVFGGTYRPAIHLLWILAPGGVLLTVSQVMSDLLRGMGHPGAIAKAQLVGVFSIAVLLASLVPWLGVTGAAIGSTLAYAVPAAMLWARLTAFTRLSSTVAELAA